MGRFIKIMYDRISCPIYVKKENPDRWVGIVQLCLIVEISIVLFKENLRCSYHQALAETLMAVNRDFVKQLGLENELDVICAKFICLGDPYDRNILERRK